MAAVIEPLRVGRGMVGDVYRCVAAGFGGACDVGDGLRRHELGRGFDPLGG